MLQAIPVIEVFEVILFQSIYESYSSGHFIPRTSSFVSDFYGQCFLKVKIMNRWNVNVFQVIEVLDITIFVLFCSSLVCSFNVGVQELLVRELIE